LAMAAMTRLRLSSATAVVPLRILETVLGETPASRATSITVTLSAMVPPVFPDWFPDCISQVCMFRVLDLRTSRFWMYALKSWITKMLF
jgi:hypothetical protein